MRKLPFVAAMLVLGAGCARPAAPVVSVQETYCGSDGALTAVMPIQSHRSYCIVSDAGAKTYPVGTPVSYSFMVVNDLGETAKDFAVTHTKLMHVIVVRKDLGSFLHLHPAFDPATGRFTLADLTFPSDGPYRIFADFAVPGGMRDPMGNPLAITLSQDVVAGLPDAYVAEALGPEQKAKTFDGYQVTLSTGSKAMVAGTEQKLAFKVSKGGKPVALEDYLGALGHSVILREGALDFIHTHPEGAEAGQGRAEFAAFFPEAGNYKIFTQFQLDGTVVTTDFTVSVGAGDTGGGGVMMGH